MASQQKHQLGAAEGLKTPQRQELEKEQIVCPSGTFELEDERVASGSLTYLRKNKTNVSSRKRLQENYGDRRLQYSYPSQVEHR